MALVQLAALLGCGAPRCYLLHIAVAGIPPSLRDILCSPVRMHCILPLCDRPAACRAMLFTPACMHAHGCPHPRPAWACISQKACIAGRS